MLFTSDFGIANQTNSQNGNPSKINLEKVACFSSPKNDRQLTSLHQRSTTTSPAKNHVLYTLFAKTPSKNGVNQPRKKILQKRSPLGFSLRPAAAWEASYREALGI